MPHENLWLPAHILRKSLRPAGLYIGGMATLDDTIDLDQQLLQTTGVIDSLSYLEKFGKVNWNHGDDPGDMLGEIVKAIIKKALGKSGLYIEAKLNEKNPKAVRAYKAMEGGARFGFSVQGVTLKLRKANFNGFPVDKIDEAFVSQVALTAEPKNYNTFAGILKSLTDQTIQKALTAGTGTDHAQFSGGRALTRENMGTAAPRSDVLQLARHFHRTYGPEPANLNKSLALFSTTWQLSPSMRERLAEHLGRS